MPEKCNEDANQVCITRQNLQYSWCILRVSGSLLLSEILNRELLHDGAVGLLDMPTALANVRTYRLEPKLTTLVSAICRRLGNSRT